MSPLLKTFIGEYIEFLVKTSVIDDETEGVLPLPVQGYLLDMDSEFLYLGDSPLNINKFIKKDLIIYGEVTKQKTVYDQIIEQIEIPNKDDKIN